MTTIVLADDHAIVRQGLRALLETDPEMEIVGESADGLTALELIEDLRPDIAIVDVTMPDLSGLEVVRRVARRSPDTAVIVLSMHADEGYVIEALRSGAAGYVLKSTSTSSIIDAIREVMHGRRYLSPPFTQRAIEAYIRASEEEGHEDAYETLTLREREVLHLVAQGHTNAEIAARLVISPRTVETHRANLMRKLNLHTQADLWRYSLRRGIISGE